MSDTLQHIAQEEAQARRIAGLVADYLRPYLPQLAPAPMLLTVDEVAERLRVSPETIRLWVRTGRIPASHVTTTIPYRISPLALSLFSAATAPTASGVSASQRAPAAAGTLPL